MRATLMLIALLLTAVNAQAMGLRSFVALPVDRDGTVLRVQSILDPESDTAQLETSFAYGLNARHALLAGVPYLLDQGGADRFGDVSMLYRPTVFQRDTAASTFRAALLGGFLFPTDTRRDEALQGGFVTTWFRDRHEVDFDLLYQSGTGSRVDSGRYDLSWQYRLAPAVHPDWGFQREWYSVLEIGGRWQEGRRVDHQVTVGLQYVLPRVVLEGGLTESLVGGSDPQILFSVRVHF